MTEISLNLIFQCLGRLKSYVELLQVLFVFGLLVELLPGLPVPFEHRNRQALDPKEKNPKKNTSEPGGSLSGRKVAFLLGSR